MNLQDVMTKLYASEINCSVSCLWDGGWDVSIGLTPEDETSVQTLEEAAEWLDEAARKHYPQSDYAQTVRTEHGN